MWPVYGIDYLARLTGKRKAQEPQATRKSRFAKKRKVASSATQGRKTPEKGPADPEKIVL